MGIEAIKRLEFSIPTTEQIIGYSAIEINNTFDLESLALGANLRERCSTCHSGYDDCPGHFGYITLTTPMFNPIYFKPMLKILSLLCLNCAHVNHNGLDSAGKFKYKHKDRSCTKCNAAIPTIKPYNNTHAVEIKYTDKQKTSTDKQNNPYPAPFSELKILPADEILLFLKKIEHESTFTIDGKDVFLRDLSQEYRQRYVGVSKNVVDMIYTVLPVIPTPCRPIIFNSTNRWESEKITVNYKEVIKSNNKLKRIKRKNTTPYHVKRIDLQITIDNLITGSSPSNYLTADSADKRYEIPKSISERIKGKQGRFRHNLMGKRVDFAARSVATGDANIAVDQIGIPISIARNLTFPEKVTSFNIDYLKNAIKKNRANYIIKKTGEKYDLDGRDGSGPVYQLCIGDTVERHMKNGDMVVINRQPTLHKGSMFALRARILPGSTLRTNLSVTTPLNLDFDGDEVNIHFPQNYESIAELQEIMSIDKILINPQDESPMIGLVQDSLLGAYKLTQKSTFFEKDEIMDLVMHLTDSYEIPTPAILVPDKYIAGRYNPIWTGCQVFSMTIPDTLTTEISPSSELIRHGYICIGPLSKKTLGRGYNSIFRCLVQRKNNVVRIINELQQIITQYLTNTGFSVGIADCFVEQFKKKEYLDQVDIEFPPMSLAPFTTGSLLYRARKERWDKSTFEYVSESKLTQVRDKIGNEILSNVDANNSFMIMANAGSKGSKLNITQISGILGQQSIDGKRVPDLFKNRTLPHFHRGDMGAKPKGFIKHSFLEGLKPHEFFMHAISGRVGLLATATETSRSGYISKRIMKSCESIEASYDGTVRDSSNRIIQFKYGNDGTNPMCCKRISIKKLLNTLGDHLGKLHTIPTISPNK